MVETEDKPETETAIIIGETETAPLVSNENTHPVAVKLVCFHCLNVVHEMVAKEIVLTQHYILEYLMPVLNMDCPLCHGVKPFQLRAFVATDRDLPHQADELSEVNGNGR